MMSFMGSEYTAQYPPGKITTLLPAADKLRQDGFCEIREAVFDSLRMAWPAHAPTGALREDIHLTLGTAGLHLLFHIGTHSQKCRLIWVLEDILSAACGQPLTFQEE